MLKDSAWKILRQAILTWEKRDLPFLPSSYFFFLFVKVGVLHGFLMKGIFEQKNVLLVSFGRFILAKILPIKSFSYKNVRSRFFSNIAVTTIGFFLL